jgi:two-component system sensor histidine kinase KdpD
VRASLPLIASLAHLLHRPLALGVAAAIGLTAALTALLLPLRSDLGSATVALVLVVPVVAGVSVGGFGAGLVGVVACFLVYDYLFLPPYYTLYISRGSDWVALGVYAVVAVIVARVVAALRAARGEAQRRNEELRRLFDLSELLVREDAGSSLLQEIVSSVLSAFDLEGVALLLPVEGLFHPVASAGSALAPEEAAYFSGTSSPVRLGPLRAPGWQAVALAASGKAIGLLAVCGARGGHEEQELMRAFANHLAIALERSMLREEAMRARVLAEVDKLRRALVGAVSHDLRTPLATIKLSASTLLDSAASLPVGDLKELVELIDAQADRLDRLVVNLLDMTRLQAGALELRRQVLAIEDLVEEALAVLGRSSKSPDVVLEVPEGLPLVEVDPVLMRQAIVNLLDNAFRYSPPGAAVTIEARGLGPQDAPERADSKLAGELTVAGHGGGANDSSGHPRVEVAVTDCGPGVAEEDRERIFEMFERREAGGRGGLGLAIARAFIEAHGERIWVCLPRQEEGARFAFTLPQAEPWLQSSS